MSDIFYYFGLIFIAYTINNLIDLFKPSKADAVIKDMEGIMEGGLDPENIMGKVSEIQGHSKQMLKKEGLVPGAITNTCLMIWIVMGYFYNTEEKYYFLLEIVISILSTLTIFGISLSSAMDGMKEFKSTGKVALNVDANRFTTWAKLQRCITIGIISYILIHHFFQPC